MVPAPVLVTYEGVHAGVAVGVAVGVPVAVAVGVGVPAQMPVIDTMYGIVIADAAVTSSMTTLYVWPAGIVTENVTGAPTGLEPESPR